MYLLSLLGASPQSESHRRHPHFLRSSSSCRLQPKVCSCKGFMDKLSMRPLEEVWIGEANMLVLLYDVWSTRSPRVCPPALYFHTTNLFYTAVTAISSCIMLMVSSTHLVAHQRVHTTVKYGSLSYLHLRTVQRSSLQHRILTSTTLNDFQLSLASARCIPWRTILTRSKT